MEYLKVTYFTTIAYFIYFFELFFFTLDFFTLGLLTLFVVFDVNPQLHFFFVNVKLLLVIKFVILLNSITYYI
jgi:hypothetical protein